MGMHTHTAKCTVVQRGFAARKSPIAWTTSECARCRWSAFTFFRSDTRGNRRCGERNSDEIQSAVTMFYYCPPPTNHGHTPENSGWASPNLNINRQVGWRKAQFNTVASENACDWMKSPNPKGKQLNQSRGSSAKQLFCLAGLVTQIRFHHTTTDPYQYTTLQGKIWESGNSIQKSHV
ncbi:hypothetical protein BDD12DRAFT_847263 [Trichophaea hybrida]|nr:hypothetical protein BDD12DRAFT_847263 [Trichophaea hybrida]